MTRYLSVSYQCWNCTNGCPTHDNGTFKYLAIEPNLDGVAVVDAIEGEIHPICETCYSRGNMQVAWGEVPVYEQYPDGTIIVD